MANTPTSIDNGIFTTTVDAAGTVVSVDRGLNPDNSAAVTRWTMDNLQAEKHLPQFTKLSAGDKSAIRDAAAETKARLALDAKNK